MEGSNLPPPAPPQPGIGESGKLKSTLDLLNIAKILALVIGILLFLFAAWEGLWIALGNIFAIPWVGYYVFAGIINLLIYTKIPEFEALIKGRRYSEAKDAMLLWAILGIIFGFIVGLILIIVALINLEDLQHREGYVNAPPPPPQY